MLDRLDRVRPRVAGVYGEPNRDAGHVRYLPHVDFRPYLRHDEAPGRHGLARYPLHEEIVRRVRLQRRELRIVPPAGVQRAVRPRRQRVAPTVVVAALPRLEQLRIPSDARFERARKEYPPILGRHAASHPGEYRRVQLARLARDYPFRRFLRQSARVNRALGLDSGAVRERDSARIDALGHVRHQPQRLEPLRKVAELPLRLAIRRPDEPEERGLVAGPAHRPASPRNPPLFHLRIRQLQKSLDQHQRRDNRLPRLLAARHEDEPVVGQEYFGLARRGDHARLLLQYVHPQRHHCSAFGKRKAPAPKYMGRAPSAPHDMFSLVYPRHDEPVKSGAPARMKIPSPVRGRGLEPAPA